MASEKYIRKVFDDHTNTEANLKSAIYFAHANGGRIAKLESGEIRWYSPDYTMGAIFEDFQGGAVVGGYCTWQEWLADHVEQNWHAGLGPIS